MRLKRAALILLAGCLGAVGLGLVPLTNASVATAAVPGYVRPIVKGSVGTGSQTTFVSASASMTVEGDSIIVVAGAGSDTTNLPGPMHISCSDPVNGTYAHDAQFQGLRGEVVVCSKINAHAFSNQAITITTDLPVSVIGLAAVQYSGLVSSPPIPPSAAGTASGTSVTTEPMPAGPALLIMTSGTPGQSSTPTYTPGTNGTSTPCGTSGSATFQVPDNNFFADTALRADQAYCVVDAAGLYTGTATYSSTGAIVTMLVAYSFAIPPTPTPTSSSTATASPTPTATPSPTPTATPLPTTTPTSPPATATPPPPPSSGGGGGGGSAPKQEPAVSASAPEVRAVSGAASGAGPAGGASAPTTPLSGSRSPLPPGLPPGLYVSVTDGAISLSNRGGQVNFSAGQFGFTAAINVPPIPVPRLPGLNFVPPPSMFITVNPQPVLPDQLATGALGGGTAKPVGMPVDIKVTAEGVDVPGKQIPLSDEAAKVIVQVFLPVPVPPIPGQQTGYLMEVRDPKGTPLGYIRPPSSIDPASGLMILMPTLGELGGTVFLPVVFEQAFVRNFDPSVHMWSNPFADAVDFGPAAPQWTRMEVMAPELGRRLPVLNAFTGGIGWVDAAGVGPVLAEDGLPAVPPSDG